MMIVNKTKKKDLYRWLMCMKTNCDGHEGEWK